MRVPVWAREESRARANVEGWSIANSRDATLFLPPSGDEIARGKPDFWVVFGEGQPLDLNKFYVIMPDSIGHGRSIKPSDGLKAHFPHYGYRDMVSAQHWLVTKHLGVDHLRLVLGVSMGGMHTWLWGEIYPTMMDALFPISGPASRDRRS